MHLKIKIRYPRNFTDMSYEAHIKSHTDGAHMSITAPNGTQANRCAEQQECDKNKQPASLLAIKHTVAAEFRK